ncbi:MAG: hypothetical protein JXA99_02125 [Candidatus Lokiarchaeota archaeon]|nr:hypothetical protein [Candidatus Lokiarchaeota archaeon]
MKYLKSFEAKKTSIRPLAMFNIEDILEYYNDDYEKTHEQLENIILYKRISLDGENIFVPMDLIYNEYFNPPFYIMNRFYQSDVYKNIRDMLQLDLNRDIYVHQMCNKEKKILQKIELIRQRKEYNL